MDRYDHQSIEKKWQERWAKEKSFHASDTSRREKKYILDMFPYPSAEGLHVGHPEGYTASDIYSRYLRMKGFEVLHPMGFDAFGLPAENYALKTGTHPAVTTAKNIENMRRQIQSLGFSYDWDREVITSDPKYYRWTQWIFLKLFEHGLAYEADAPINWCPKDKTGLANEEVIDGKCERCGTPVTKKKIKQWLVKITDERYIERLLNDLDKVDWPENIKLLQKNWIGKSEGAEIVFKIQNPKLQTRELTVFTTRPDTIFGATYMVVAPEHPLVQDALSMVENKSEVEKYIHSAVNKSDLERTDLVKVKTGVELKGIKAIRPVDGQEIPIWAADYVLMSYGTGAIMAVPAHDQRDFEFAKKYSLPVKQVMAPFFQNTEDLKLRSDKPMVRRKLVYGIVRNPKNNDVLCLRWKKYDWVSFVVGGVEDGEDLITAAKREIAEETGYINLKFVEEINWQTHFTFFAKHKNENRYGMASGVVFDLVDETRHQIHNEEKEKHEPVWVSEHKVLDAVTHLNAKEIWQYYVKPAAFIGEGVAINSGEYDGLTTVQCKKKIIARLEKDGRGRFKVQYKLRDWLFSRQRYWGEPIPIVHCEHCRKQKKETIVIIHGTGSNGKANWYDWLATKLRELGHQVIVPDMPDSKQPDREQWLTALETLKNAFDEHTILIGHSLGGIAAMYFLASRKKKIKKLILVAPTSTEMDWTEFQKQHPDNPAAWQRKFHEAELRYADVQKNTEKISYYYSDNDAYIPAEIPEWYKKKLRGDYHLLPGRNHFSLKNGHAYTFPEVLEEIVGKNPLPVGVNPVHEKDLPVELPNVKKYEPTGTGESPLASIEKWVNVKCPKCGKPAKRETNTMPQWAGSNWYFLRYCDPKNDKKLADPKKLEKWLPVDMYIGGAEHAVLHLLYARFIYKFLCDIEVVPKSFVKKHGDEPFTKLKNQGLILGEDGQKMSKSRGNVINPDEVIKKFGADTMRMYEMFMGPFEDAKPWSTQGMIGVKRFLERVWNVFVDQPAQVSAPAMATMNKRTHQLVKKITVDIEQFKFNTAVSEYMKYTNAVAEAPAEFLKQDFEVLLRLLSPFAPHLSEELWEQLGHKESISKEPWPSFDPKLIVEDEITIVVQINGKVRDQMKVASDISEDEAKKLALSSEKVLKWLDGKQPKKVIYIKGRLVSIVV